MSRNGKQERCVTLLQGLMRAQATAWTITQKLAAECGVELAADASTNLANLLGSQMGALAASGRQPIVDHGAMDVIWAGRPCRLGNTILLRLMDRLARRTNQYISFDRLLRDVWDGQTKSDETIRNAVLRLKRELRAAGMEDLAVAIRSSRRSYGLMLDGAAE